MRFGRIIAVPRSIGLRRAGLTLLVSLALTGALAAASRAAETVLHVSLDKAKLIKYPPTTETVVVGNPIIADVTMLRDSGTLILTGRGFGETNLVFLDHTGTVLSETELRVEGSGSLLTVQRGMDRESYSCHPRCEPSVSLGDAASYFGGISAEITQRNNLAVPSAPAPIVR